MSNDPKERHHEPSGRIADDLNEIDRAMLLAISHRQRDGTPLSLDQEWLLDNWTAGRLPPADADRAAQLTKQNKLAAERILERRLIAAASSGPDVPSALEARILKASPPSKTGGSGIFSLQWTMFSAWQWSGLSAAAAAVAIVAIFGFQGWQAQLRSDKSFTIAMVALDDRSVLAEGSRYRTRGSQQQSSTAVTSLPGASTTTPITSLPGAPTESRFRDIDVPTALLRQAINSAATGQQSVGHSELMAYLRAHNDALNIQARLLIDSALSDNISQNIPEFTSTQVRVYDLDDPRSSEIRKKIQTLQANVSAILLTLRR